MTTSPKEQPPLEEKTTLRHRKNKNKIREGYVAQKYFIWITSIFSQYQDGQCLFGCVLIYSQSQYIVDM